jgi:hypothetical protein
MMNSLEVGPAWRRVKHCMQLFVEEALMVYLQSQSLDMIEAVISRFDIILNALA